MTRPVVSHYVVGLARIGVGTTLCGFEVYADHHVPDDAPRCEVCVERHPMIGTAVAYAKRQAITPEAAAKALNMPSTVALAVRGFTK